MTFHDFFHDLFKFSKTLGLAVTFKNFKKFPCFKSFFKTLKSSKDTNSGVHRNVCRLRWLITYFYHLHGHDCLVISSTLSRANS